METGTINPAAVGAFQEIARAWAPPPRLTVSQWADENRKLSSESSAKTGQWVTRPYQREPQDVFTDPRVHTIVLMVARQTLKTEVINNCLGYLIDKDPGPTLIVQYRDTDCKRFSKIRLAPMLRDTPCLQGKVSEAKSRDSANTFDYKAFNGGHVSIVASSSPGNLAALPIRYVFCDEIDKYPASADKAGDPISLAQGRQEEFWNRKTVLACTPTIKGESRIETAYLQGDRREYEVKCSICSESQVLKWGQVRWNSRLPREQMSDTARYHCEHCDAPWTDLDRIRAVRDGGFKATAPFNGIASFRLSGLCRISTSLRAMVEEFLNKKDNPESLKTFVNEQLAECWETRGEAPKWQGLYDRSEEYEVGKVPVGGLLLTAAVDAQADRLEFEVKAWGRGKQSWSVYYEVIALTRVDSKGKIIQCRTSDPEPWERLAELIAQDWPVAGGGAVPLMAVAIDTGYNSEKVYDFCRRYPQPAHGPTGSRVQSYRTVIPIKGGHSAFKLIENVSGTDAAKKRGGLKIVTIGTPNAKQEIYDALRMDSPVDGAEFPPGYCHHPKYESSYFQGLCAETRIVTGNGDIEWRKDGRNEPLDLHVYNRAAAELCGVSTFQESAWKELERRITASAEPPSNLPEQPKVGPHTGQTSSGFHSSDQQRGADPQKPQARPVRFRYDS